MPLVMNRCGCEGNIKIYLIETESHNVDRVNLTLDSVKEGVGGFSERDNKLSCSMKGREVLVHVTHK
jgi:hypothetical protein